MARSIVTAALPREECRLICEILDRCARAKPDEQYAETFGGIDDTHVGAADVPLSLAEVIRLQAVKRCIEAAVHRFAGRPQLVVDYTLFKRARTGHRKGPHHDAGNPVHAHRIYTALLYFNDCDSGAVEFGSWRSDGATDRRQLEVEERVLPETGKLLIFDDAPSNVHRVEEFRGEARYSVMSWFCLAPERARLDWVVRYLVDRRDVRLRVAAADLSLDETNPGAFQLRGLSGPRRFAITIGPAHLGWLDRLLDHGHFSAAQLVGEADAALSPARFYELLGALAKAGAIDELPRA
jgi:hypothetical protein